MPLSSELETDKPVSVTFWPWLEPFSVEKRMDGLKLMPDRSAVVLKLACKCHPRFFDEQLGPTVGAIDYVTGSGNFILSFSPPVSSWN